MQRKVVIAFSVLALVSSLTMFFRLPNRPVENFDEGIHGDVIVEMVKRQSLITPYYRGDPYFRKPPLRFWLGIHFYKYIGVNTFTLRFWSALAGVGTVLLVAWWIWQWRRRLNEAILTGLIIATMRPIFFHAFRTGEMDGLLTFFIVLTLYTWWRAKSNPKWFLAVGVGLGLGVMTKSAAGLLPIPIILLDAVLGHSWRVALREWRWLLAGAGVTLAISTPWHIAMSLIHGQNFWEIYLGKHILQRTTQTLRGHNEDAAWWWHLKIFMKYFAPYSFWFIPAWIYTARHTLKRHNCEAVLWIVWPLTIIGLFTLARTRLDWYILPAYPAAAWLVARYLLAYFRYPKYPLVWGGHLTAAIAFILSLRWLVPPGGRLEELASNTWLLILATLLLFVFLVSSLNRVSGFWFRVSQIKILVGRIIITMLIVIPTVFGLVHNFYKFG